MCNGMCHHFIDFVLVIRMPLLRRMTIDTFHQKVVAMSLGLYAYPSSPQS